jgi:hypothetical protein|tara:strand:+ start:216 stop:536 length:321 start_codon:yes stop_codon:yes gene_type:complete
MKQVNKKRKLKVKATVWGPPGYREHVQAQPCAVRGCTNRPSEPHHEPHRYPQGRGTWRDLIPLCGDHHTKGGCAVHRIGVDSFREMFGLDWDEIKTEVLALWTKKS